jgi:hypothetical protein
MKLIFFAPPELY